MQFHMLSFECPDAYSRAGGLASRADGLVRALAGLGFEDDPDYRRQSTRGRLGSAAAPSLSTSSSGKNRSATAIAGASTRARLRRFGALAALLLGVHLASGLTVVRYCPSGLTATEKGLARAVPSTQGPSPFLKCSPTCLASGSGCRCECGRTLRPRRSST